MTDIEPRKTLQVIGDVMHDIRVAEDDLRTEQDAALRRYMERVDAILAFGIPVTEDADHEDHTHVVDALRTRLGDLRVRAHLGAMDGEDLVEHVSALLRRLGT